MKADANNVLNKIAIKLFEYRLNNNKDVKIIKLKEDRILFLTLNFLLIINIKHPSKNSQKRNIGE